MPKYNFSIILISLACKICIFKIKRVFVSQSNPKSQFPKFWNHEFLLKFWDFCLRYIFWSYISHFKSNLSGVKSKSVIHIMRPHIEKKNAKIFKIGRVIAIFVRLTEFRNESKKSRKAVFQPFWINTKKSYFIQIFNPGHNIMSLLKRNIQGGHKNFSQTNLVRNFTIVCKLELGCYLIFFDFQALDPKFVLALEQIYWELVELAFWTYPSFLYLGSQQGPLILLFGGGGSSGPKGIFWLLRAF